MAKVPREVNDSNSRDQIYPGTKTTHLTYSFVFAVGLGNVRKLLVM